MSDPVVLVLDDEEEIAEFVADVVDMNGISVSYISDSDLLVSALQSSVQLLILDLLMPKHSGIELIEMVAVQKTLPALILMSGETSAFIQEASDHATQLGFNVIGILNKPFFATDLEALLEKCPLSDSP